MAFNNVPWFIDNGAQHPAAVERALAYLATGGNEGVGAPADFKVKQTAVASNRVLIDPGVIAMLNRHAGDSNGQTYIGRAPSQTQTDIISPTAGASRSDLVVVRVEDPNYAPWPVVPVEDRPNWPYFKPVIIPDVSPTVKHFADLGLAYAGYAPARIDIPAGTSNITDAMIKDLRNLVQPKSQRVIEMTIPTVENTLPGFEDPWPDFAPSIAIPRWATKCQVAMTLSMVGQRTGPVTGHIAVVLGGSLAGANLTYDFDAPTAGERRTVVALATFTGAAFRAMAGTSQVVKTMATKTAGTGHLVTVAGTHMMFDVQFTEEII